MSDLCNTGVTGGLLLSDMLRKETGKTVLNFIHDKVVDLGKTYLVSSENTITEIVYSLGFQYSQHFTRLFKKEVGCTPNEYRRQFKYAGMVCNPSQHK